MKTLVSYKSARVKDKVVTSHTALTTTPACWSRYLDAKQGGVDDEVATLIEDGVGLWGLRVGHQVLLPSQAPPKVNGLQVVQLRFPSL